MSAYLSRNPLTFGQLRSAFADLAFTTVIVLIAALWLGLHENANLVVTQTLAVTLTTSVRGAAIYALAFLLPLPLLVCAINRAPKAGLARYSWLVPAIVLYGAFAAWLPALWFGARIVVFTQGALVGVGLAVTFELHYRATRRRDELLRAQTDVVRLASELQRASLSQLRAQIEPHFLFNTLATIRRLAQVDHPAATKMLGDLIRYFAVALPRLKQDESTLGTEAELAAAYLDIHRVRMGSRMAYEIAIPQELANARIPTMVLLTLVENAIKHGLGPLVEGGFIRVSARRSGDALEIEVADTGRGMTEQHGHGTGLSNVRARLALLYGRSATVKLARGQPRGVVATISLPARLAA